MKKLLDTTSNLYPPEKAEKIATEMNATDDENRLLGYQHHKGKHTYTHVEAQGLVCGQYVCNDCGASSWLIEKVEHYPNCKPGESAYWENYYNQIEQGDD